jgi:hypothetical protein
MSRLSEKVPKNNKTLNVICSFLCFKATQTCVILIAFEGREDEVGEKRVKLGNSEEILNEWVEYYLELNS